MDLSRLIARTKAILLTPKTEWPVIAGEPASVAGLFSGYIVYLAAIPPLAAFLQMSLIGTPVGMYGSIRVGFGPSLTALAVGYAFGLAGIWLLALVVDALAPTFAGRKDPVMAMKTVAYAGTAGWIAGIGLLLPSVAPLLALVGVIYSIYVLYLGLPVTMQCPADKAAGYTATVAVAAIVIGALATSLTGNYFYRPALVAPVIPTAVAPGVAPSVVASQMQTQAAAVGQWMQSTIGAGRAVEPLAAAAMREMLPDSLPGRKRSSATAQKSGVAGAELSTAHGSYSDSRGRPLTIEIKDTGGGPNAMVLAGFAAIDHEQVWDGGYDRSFRDGGRLVQERWDVSSGMGHYGVFLNGRFAVRASGFASGIDELKAAASSVDLGAIGAAAN